MQPELQRSRGALPRIGEVRTAVLALRGVEVEVTDRRPALVPALAYSLEAAPLAFSLGDRTEATSACNGQVSGPTLRVPEGGTLRVMVQNRLPAPHGMDGVPVAAQQAIEPGERYTSRFTVPTAGASLHRSHVGLRLDLRRSDALVIHPAREAPRPNRDDAALFDDWLDGMLESPELAAIAGQRVITLVEGSRGFLRHRRAAARAVDWPRQAFPGSAMVD